MALLSEKIDFLRKNFMEMDYNRDSLLTREELYKFLDYKVSSFFQILLLLFFK